MSVALPHVSQALSQPPLNGVITFDQQGKLVVEDEVAARVIMLNSSADSLVYKIVQLALHTQFLREQQEAAADRTSKLSALQESVERDRREIKILRTKVQDIRTQREIEKCRLDLNKKATEEAWDNIGIGALLTLSYFAMGLGIPKITKGIDALSQENSTEFVWMQNKMDLYRAFYPAASLTEAFQYVKQHPAESELTRSQAEQLTSIQDYKEQYPRGTFEDYVALVEHKIKAIESEYRSSTDSYGDDLDYDMGD